MMYHVTNPCSGSCVMVNVKLSTIWSHPLLPAWRKVCILFGKLLVFPVGHILSTTNLFNTCVITCSTGLCFSFCLSFLSSCCSRCHCCFIRMDLRWWVMIKWTEGTVLLPMWLFLCYGQCRTLFHQKWSPAAILVANHHPTHTTLIIIHSLR